MLFTSFAEGHFLYLLMHNNNYFDVLQFLSNEPAKYRFISLLGFFSFSTFGKLAILKMTFKFLPILTHCEQFKHDDEMGPQDFFNQSFHASLSRA